MKNEKWKIYIPGPTGIDSMVELCVSMPGFVGIIRKKKLSTF